jgi:hypothetical protein
MTETPADRPEPTTVASASRPAEPPTDGYYRLGAAAAWVGIVAGVVFIVAVIFFAGFFLGIHAKGYHGHHGHGDGTEHDGGPGGIMGPGGMMGPGSQQGPAGPGGMTGPGGMMGPGSQQGPIVTVTVVPIPGRP